MDPVPPVPVVSVPPLAVVSVPMETVVSVPIDAVLSVEPVPIDAVVPVVPVVGVVGVVGVVASVSWAQARPILLQATPVLTGLAEYGLVSRRRLCSFVCSSNMRATTRRMSIPQL